MRGFFNSPESFFLVLVIIAFVGGLYSNQWSPLFIIVGVYMLLVLIGVIK